MKNIIRTVIATVTLGLCTTAVHAGNSERSLVREAHRVIDYSEALKCEVVKHFRHTNEYRHLLSDAAKIRAEARHIDGLAHHVRSLRDINHIKADLRDLDDLVHHVGDMIEDIDRGCARGGRAHGDTRHVVSLVAAINRSIHSMERTVRDMERHYSCEYDRDRGHGHSSSSRSYTTNRSYSRSSSSRSTGQRIAGSILREVLRHR